MDDTDNLVEINAQLRSQIMYLENRLAQLERTELALEIANDRWVQQVNENTGLQIELKLMRKANNNGTN